MIRAVQEHTTQFTANYLALITGARLGPYEILSALGAGGMGEVYRATDTRLKRQVAIKILPPLLATDPDRLARFEREAQVLASLNHPNIGGIHGLEDADGVRALVLELVEGPTLADRIAQGPIPLDEAELSPRTFWNFAGEFSSFRRQGVATGGRR